MCVGVCVHVHVCVCVCVGGGGGGRHIQLHVYHCQEHTIIGTQGGQITYNRQQANTLPQIHVQ